VAQAVGLFVVMTAGRARMDNCFKCQGSESCQGALWRCLLCGPTTEFGLVPSPVAV